MYSYGIELVLLPIVAGAAFLSALDPAESTRRGSRAEGWEHE